MKTSLYIFVSSVFILLAGRVSAQAIPGEILGAWKGSSICQVKNSPCHDETVVYHITLAKDTGMVNIVANKIVNNEEDSMGTIIFRYVAKEKMLISVSPFKDDWKLKWEGKTMDGTLYHKGELYRVIKLAKQ